MRRERHFSETILPGLLALVLFLAPAAAGEIGPGVGRQDGSGDPLGDPGDDPALRNLAERPPEPDPFGGSPSPDGWIDDRDGDGFLDPVDNCLEHANPAQVDADMDGFGNRCDPDFDDDGDVDRDDEDSLRRVMEGGAETPREEREHDLDEDGDVDDSDLEILLDFLDGAPGPVQDSDADGAPDAGDPCPSTPIGSVPLFSGCAALDLALDPEALTGPLADDVEERADGMADDPERDALVRHLREAAAALRDAARGIHDAGPCGADEPMDRARGQFSLALEEMDRLVALESRETPAAQEEFTDVHEEDLDLIHALFDQDAIASDDTRAAGIQDAFGSLCERGTRTEGTGVIRSIDDATGTFELEDGRVVGLSDDAEVSGYPGPGEDVGFYGYDYGDLTLSADVVESANAQYDLLEPSCVAFRFAPVQRWAEWGGPTPYELLHPDAYELSGSYRFERGMRFAAERTCPADTLAPVFDRYSLRVEVHYRYSSSQTTPYVDTIALDLTPAMGPVTLPDKYWNENTYETVDVHVETLERTCSIAVFPNLNCSDPVVVAERDYPLDRRARGSLCSLSYYDTEFALDDQVDGDWTQTWVNNVVYLMASDTPVQFRAQGYEMCPKSGGGWKPCTSPSTIFENHSFVLRNWDTHPVHHADDAATVEFLREVTGVDRAAGLAWPRLRGTRNGHTWQVSCTPPKVVRDHLAFCSGGTHTLYRLPFSENVGPWSLWQGNLSGGNNSHATGYALDMGGGCNSALRAARSGVVVQTIGNLSCMNHTNCSTSNAECGSLCCTSTEVSNGQHVGNMVRIRHQDGSHGLYLHLRPNGVAVSKDEIVQRGEYVGLMGTTGRSSGPHLHWESEGPAPNFTGHLSLFEARNPSDLSQTMTCYEPDEGDTLWSTNEPQP